MIEKIKAKFNANKYYCSVLLLFMLVGIGLRLYFYFQNYSFNMDEAALAVGIIRKKSYLDILFSGLNSITIAPYGMLLVSKVIIDVFGTSEAAFRAFPLLCSLISIPLFYYFAKKYLKTTYSILLAIFLFSIAPMLVQYSFFFKQYSTDVLATLVIFVFIDKFLRSEKIKILPAALLGAVFIWFSLPAIFVLAALGSFYMFIYLKKRENTNLYKLIGIGFIWIISFSLLFFLIKRNEMQDFNFLQNSWKNLEAFMPVPFNIEWFLTTLFLVVKDIFNVKNILVSVSLGVLMITGSFLFIHKEKINSLLVFLPVFFALLASAGRFYPFMDRHILYLVPIFIILIAKNLDIFEKFNLKLTVKNILFILISAGFLFVIGEMHPRTDHNMDTVYKFIKNNEQQGDFIYIRFVQSYSFPYDKDKYAFGDNISYGGNYLAGKQSLNDYCSREKRQIFLQNELDDLKKRHQRVWFPFYMDVYPEELKFYKQYLSRSATLIKSKLTDNAEVYLYEFNP